MPRPTSVQHSTWAINVRVPGAHTVKIKQRKQGWDAASGRTRRQWVLIRKCSNLDTTPNGATYCKTISRKGRPNRSPVGWKWQVGVKVTAYFGSGATASQKTWSFNVRKPQSKTFHCNSCVALATPPRTAIIKQSTGPTETAPGPTIIGVLASPYDAPAKVWTPGTTIGTTTIVTTGTGNGDADTTEEVVVIDADMEGASNEEIEATAEDLDALLDEDVVVELTPETEEALAEVEEDDDDDDVAEAGPLAGLPMIIPAEVIEPYIYPGAGAAIGAVAGKFLGDRTLAGAVLGGLAGWYLGKGE